MRAQRITYEQEQQVIELRGKMSAVKIAEMLGLNYNQVTDVYRRYNLTNKLEPIFNLSPLQHQIIISGILGDGNLKQNGKNCYYRENHSVNQLEYLKWKHKMLKPFTRDSMLYNVPSARIETYEFCTITSPTFNKYKAMNYYEVIQYLDDIGILLFILDDGWVTHNRNFIVSCGDKPKAIADYLSIYFNMHGLYGSHVIYQNKLKDFYNIYIPAENNEKLFKLAINLLGNIDIIKSKFGQLNKIRDGIV